MSHAVKSNVWVELKAPWLSRGTHHLDPGAGQAVCPREVMHSDTQKKSRVYKLIGLKIVGRGKWWFSSVSVYEPTILTLTTILCVFNFKKTVTNYPKLLAKSKWKHLLDSSQALASYLYQDTLRFNKDTFQLFCVFLFLQCELPPRKCRNPSGQ